ncbi:MAG: biotin--[acetyl-CoA-carboxylase] ligase [Methanomicrobiales archaeon]|nr:biotin--[acetyl-CoA-carboxylase] ligase [Methanomicrobiales archaeon]
MDEKFAILEQLREARESLSTRHLAERTGLTPAQVASAIRSLRTMGYQIMAPKRGVYRLNAPTSKLIPYEVQRILRTAFIGHEMRYYEKISSTSAVAKDLTVQQDPSSLHGAVIVAEEQTGGTGRLGRAWVSPGGGIWTTIILKPRIPIDRLFMLTMVGSLAVVRAIKKVVDIGALIKWPNDIYIGDKKVGGVITELSAEGPIVHYVLVGIGVDVNVTLRNLPPGLRESATSLSAELGHEVDRVILLATFLREFELRYNQVESGEYDTIVREWKSHSWTLEHRVRIHLGTRVFEGDAIDIDDYGALIVRKDSGTVERVIAGDCEHI